MEVDGYGPFPFEIGDVLAIDRAEDERDLAIVLGANYAYVELVWFDTISPSWARSPTWGCPPTSRLHRPALCAIFPVLWPCPSSARSLHR